MMNPRTPEEMAVTLAQLQNASRQAGAAFGCELEPDDALETAAEHDAAVDMQRFADFLAPTEDERGARDRVAGEQVAEPVLAR